MRKLARLALGETLEEKSSDVAVRRNTLTRWQKEKTVESAKNTEDGTEMGKGRPIGEWTSALESRRSNKPQGRRPSSMMAAGKTGWNSEEILSSGEEELALGRVRGTA
jgi:hypothetical protein